MNSKTIEVNEMSYKVLSKLSQIYITMHVVDIGKDSAYEFKLIDTLKPFVNNNFGARAKIKYILENVCAPNYLNIALDFTDLDSLAERMQDKVVISVEFIGIHYGWVRTQFVALDHDEDGKVTQVLFTTQVIDEEKRKIEELKKMSFTDPLTHLYNRYAFETDKFDYIVTKNTTIYSIDLNGLKYTNDNFGHEAGDDLLRGLASCLVSVFAICGKGYRIGGDEFIVIAETNNPDGLVDRIREFNKTWSTGKDYTLACAVGYAKGESIDCMLTIADANMYKDKALYYKNKNK